jgi:peptidyl-dipeptidase Dcp
MRGLSIRSIVLLVTITMIATILINPTNNSSAMNVNTDNNPLLAKWEGPYGGVPPFDRVQIPLFKPALEAAMAERLAETEKIANNPAPPDFENTIAALERTGGTLNRVATLYGVWGATMSSPEYQVVEREMAPRLASLLDQIFQNEPLFKRIEAVYNSPAKAKLNPEQQRLTWLYYTNFVRAGARLSADAKKRVLQINQQLAGLYTKFSQNVLAEETDQFLVLKSEDKEAARHVGNHEYTLVDRSVFDLLGSPRLA